MRTRTAFTLVELLVSVAIATVILLIAAATMRLASRSLRTIQATGEQNALLARGVLEGLRDVDYWNSHADPRFPYYATAMSEPVTVSGDTDHPWDKRPFRPVTFSSTMNPDLLTADDPRGWYRGSMVTSTMPVNRPPPAYEQTCIWVTPLRCQDAVASYKFSGTDAHELGVVLQPCGWAPWHIVGDFPAQTAALAYGHGASEYADAVAAEPERAVRDHLPSLQWWIFSELGHAGTTAYLPPGALALLTRPATNRSAANIGIASRFVDWGEVPWAFARGGPGGSSFSAQAFTHPVASDLPGVTALRRRNLQLGLPGTGVQFAAVTPTAFAASQGLIAGSGAAVSSQYSNERSGFTNIAAIELETVASGVFDNSRNGRVPLALFYPGRPLRADSDGDGTPDWDFTALVDRTIEDPFRLLWDQDVEFNNWWNVAESRQDRRMVERFLRRTQHEPALATDDGRQSELFVGGQQMRHEISRFRLLGSDRARVAVVVHDALADTTLRLGFQVIGSNWKGARRHWGWKSSQPDSGLPPMGDHYAP